RLSPAVTRPALTSACDDAAGRVPGYGNDEEIGWESPMLEVLALLIGIVALAWASGVQRSQRALERRLHLNEEHVRELGRALDTLIRPQGPEPAPDAVEPGAAGATAGGPSPRPEDAAADARPAPPGTAAAAASGAAPAAPPPRGA